MFWGLTPSLDLQNNLQNQPTENELNILLVGCRDCRHILKTIAQMYRHPDVKINFYVIEQHLEQIARHVLLTSLALESDKQLGLFQKTRTFIELYGNTLLRPFTDKYLTKKASQLVEIITNAKYCQQTLPIFKLDQLKFKERDYLENVFKFWSKKNSIPFDIVKSWDKRLRRSLGTRYDSRHGIFDWDYHMRLCDRGAEQVYSREYIHWRESGVAFTWLECESSKPNMSLAAGIIPNGQQLLHYGYLGDIVTGPYIAFGLNCEDKDLLKKVNGQHIKRATDVTDRNVTRMFHEMLTKQEYVPQKNDDYMGAVISEISDLQIDLHDENCVDHKNKISFEPSINVDNVQIIFLSYSMLSTIHKKKTFNDFFHLIVFGNDVVRNINNDLFSIAKPNSTCIIENQKHLYNINQDGLKEFADQIKDTMDKCNCSLVSEFDYLKDDIMKYKVTRKNNPDEQ